MELFPNIRELTTDAEREQFKHLHGINVLCRFVIGDDKQLQVENSFEYLLRHTRGPFSLAWTRASKGKKETVIILYKYGVEVDRTHNVEPSHLARLLKKHRKDLKFVHERPTREEKLTGATSAEEDSVSLKGESIKSRAAVVWGANKPLTIEEICVAPPKEGEVRIKIMYTALCHMDTLSWSGKDLEGFIVTYPAILGHEGAGIVESVGSGVLHVAPGDKVITCFIPQCRKCASCKHGETNLCEFNKKNQARGKMPDGTSRFSCKEQTVNHFMGCSTFSEYTVCAAENVTKISEDAPLDIVCVLGCSVATGYGAAVKTAGVKPGSRCAVWGAGAAGLATVLGCKNAGAHQIVAIDFVNNKLDAAMKLGATECINASYEPNDAHFTDYLVKKYDGGFDYTFECTGNVKAMRQALEAAHKGWGVSCVVGDAAKNQEILAMPTSLLMGRRWIGSTYGDIKCQDDLPGLVKDHLDGKMHLEDFISHHVALDEINKAFGWLLKGESLRTVISVAAPSPK